MKVGQYFSLSEFTHSQAAARKGLDNTPSDKVIASIRALVEYILDPLRHSFEMPIIVSSGYRAPKVNVAVGGARNSQHTKGEAVDIVVPGWTVEGVIERIKHLKLPFDQLIDEFGEWVHVSYRPNGRQEILRARVTKKGVRYERLS